MANEEIYKDEFIINLTIDKTEYEEIEVKVTKPELPISEQIERIINVFGLLKTDGVGNALHYMFFKRINNDEYERLEEDDENGRKLSLLDNNIQSGDTLVLVVAPYL